MDALNNPEDPVAGTRTLPFSRTLYIEKEDFMEDPPKKFFRLAPGREVRLKHAYVIKCKEVVKNEEGEIVALHCTYDPETRSGSTQDGRKVKGTLHWVSARHAQKAEVRLFNHLFTHENPADEKNCPDLKSSLNPNSLEIIKEAFLEPSLKNATGQFQFLRLGYFCSENKGSSLDSQVFNRIVTLRDSWAKIAKK